MGYSTISLINFDLQNQFLTCQNLSWFISLKQIHFRCWQTYSKARNSSLIILNVHFVNVVQQFMVSSSTRFPFDFLSVIVGREGWKRQDSVSNNWLSSISIGRQTIIGSLNLQTFSRILENHKHHERSFWSQSFFYKRFLTDEILKPLYKNTY